MLGQINLTIGEAIAEIVANSFDERLDDKKLLIKIDISTNDDCVRILDNGKGMDSKKLERALKIGDSSKGKGMKGMYGIGLKTASAVIGKKFSIETAKKNSDKVLECEWDFKKFKKGGKWELPYTIKDRKDSINFSDKGRHGTVIKIEKLKNSKIYINLIKKFLSLAYKPHLLAGDKIIINKDPIKPTEYELIDNTYKTIDIKLDNNKKIKGWVGLLVEGNKQVSFKDDTRYGFNIYRNNQLVESYYKEFLPRKHGEFGRIIGELHMNFITVNYHKKGINFKNKEWKKIKEIISKEIKGHVSASRATYVSTNEWDKSVGKIKSDNWKKIKIDELNEDELINKKDKETIRRAKKMYKKIGKLKRQYPKKGKKGKSDENEDDDSDKEKLVEKDKLIKLSGNGEIMLLDEIINYNFIFYPDEKSGWKWHDSDIDKNNLTIMLNEEFSLIKKTENKKGKDNIQAKKIMCILAFAEEIRDYFIKLGYNEERCQKEVFEWIDKNYENIEVRFKK